MYRINTWHAMYRTRYNNINIEFRGKNENQTKNAQRPVLMASASRNWKSVKSNLLQGIWRGPAGTCWRIFTTSFACFVRSAAVCSSTFRRYLLLQLRNPYHIVSTVTAPQAAAQLEVACPIFFALRDEHLYISIDLSVHFSPGQLAVAAAVASSAIPLLYF